MSDVARVIKATFTEWRMVKTRKVLQLVLEIPLEQQSEVLTRLGAPMPDQEKWVAVALLDELVASETEHRAEERRAKLSIVGKERYASLSPEQQAVADAGMLAQDPQFYTWANSTRFCKFYVFDVETAARFIRARCGVASRRDIAINPDAYEAFIRLKAEFEVDVGRLPERRA
jgi:hypothetical protein